VSREERKSMISLRPGRLPCSSGRVWLLVTHGAPAGGGFPAEAIPRGLSSSNWDSFAGHFVRWERGP
jgi:hypothetical protein